MRGSSACEVMPICGCGWCGTHCARPSNSRPGGSPRNCVRGSTTEVGGRRPDVATHQIPAGPDRSEVAGPTLQLMEFLPGRTGRRSEVGGRKSDIRPPTGGARSLSLLPNLCLGGAEKVMVHLANGLAARGRKVDMLLVEAKGEFLGQLGPAVRVVDLAARRVLWAIPRLASYLRRERPAVLISALDHANVGAVFSKWLSRSAVPVVAAVHATRSMHAQRTPGIREAVLRSCITWCYRRADAVVCVSRGVADDLAAATGARRERMRVIYNPVIDQRMLALAREPLEHPWFAPVRLPWCWPWEDWPRSRTIRGSCGLLPS